MDQSTFLRVSNLCKTYKLKSKLNHQKDFGKSLFNRSDNYVKALNDVSFQLDQGECLGIIGKNGAGKSTLLKILSGIIKPTSGKVEYLGKILSIIDIGTGFHPDLMELTIFT